MELAHKWAMGAKDPVRGPRRPLSSRAPEVTGGDATSRTRSPESVREAVALLSGLLDALPDAVLVTDAEGHVLWVNREFQGLLGLSPAALNGRKVNLLAGPYEEQAEGRHVLALVRRGEGELELPAFKASGESFPCLVRVRTVEDLGGRPARIVTVTDQTEPQRLRAELVARAEIIQREKEILRATAACLDREGLVVVDETERVVLVNQAARNLLDLREGELQGKLLVELPLPGEVRGTWLAFLSGAERTISFTTRVPGPGEERTLLVRLARAWNARGLPIASFLTVRELDGTEEGEHERHEFLERIGHELRTPLASIRGFLATLRAAPDLDEETRGEFLGILDQEARRLERMVEALLEVARAGRENLHLSRRVLDLGDLVRHAIALLRERYPGTRVAARIERGPFPCWVDPTRIERVILHVLENAAVHGQGERGIDVRLAREQGRARLVVRDHGPGVPPGDLARIFDPFYRVVRAAREGPVTSGLGLAICRQVVDRHGGEIRAELPDGGGLAVVIELPLDAPGTTAPETRPGGTVSR